MKSQKKGATTLGVFFRRKLLRKFVIVVSQSEMNGEITVHVWNPKVNMSYITVKGIIRNFMLIFIHFVNPSYKVSLDQVTDLHT